MRLNISAPRIRQMRGAEMLWEHFNLQNRIFFFGPDE